MQRGQRRQVLQGPTVNIALEGDHVSGRIPKIDPPPLIKLRMLDGNEYLARPSNYYRRMRVTVKLNRRANPGKRKQARLVLPADLPIVFLMRDSMARPDFVMPTFEGCGVQQPPPRMESSVYVKTLRYHRMLPEYRELKGAPKKA